MLNKTTRFLAAAALMLLAGGAFAQTLPAAVPTDLANALLDAIIGKTENASVSVSLLGEAMRFMNQYAIAAGTMLFTYVAVIGTLNTAQDGELLGKKWSSMWIPARFTLGIALLVPLASGFSGAQEAGIVIAKGGSAAATELWSSVAKRIISGNDRMTASFNNPAYASALDGTMRAIWRAEACTAAFRDRENMDANGMSFGFHEAAGKNGSYIMQWGDPTGAAHAPDQCGTITTTSFQPTAPQTLSVVDDFGRITEVARTAPDALYDQTMIAVVAAQHTALRASIALLKPTAYSASGSCGTANRPTPCTAGTTTQNDVEKAIKRARDQYTTTVSGALSSAYSQMGDVAEKKKFEDEALKEGWITAGTSLFSMARIQSATNKMSFAMPTVSPPTESAENVGISLDDVDSAGWRNKLADGLKTTSESPGRWLLQYVSESLTGDPLNKKHILIQMKDTGDYLMGAAATALTVAGVVSTVSEAIPGGKVAQAVGAVTSFIPGGAIFKELATAGMVAVVALYIAGVMMSLILPMLPFAFWFGSIVGWIIAVFELLVATPLWIASHLHPEGDDVTGKGSHGYVILLEVAVRPVIMVVGLIGAFIASDVLGRLLGLLYFRAVDSVQADSVTGIPSICILVVLYVAIFYTTLRTCFGLTHTLHASIMRYFGGAHASHDKAAEFGGSVQNQQNGNMQQIQKVMGSLGGSVAKGLTFGGRPSSDKPDDGSDKPGQSSTR